MKEFVIKGITISFLTEEEISEFVFRGLLDKKKFFMIFADSRVLYNIIYNREYRKLLENKIVIPSSKVFSFVSGLLFGVKDVKIVKESSTIFKIIRNISDYYYRLAVVSGSEKETLRFKNNLKLNFPEMKLNMIGFNKIFGKYKHKEKIEILKKFEPNLAIFDTVSLNFVGFIEKNKDLFAKTSVIMSGRGVKIISGVRHTFRDSLNMLKCAFSYVFISFWVLKEKFLMLFSEKRRLLYAKSYRV